MPRRVAARTIERQIAREAKRGVARRLNLGTMTFADGPWDPAPTVCAAEKVPAVYPTSDGNQFLAKEWVDICSLDMAYPFAAVVRSRYRTAERTKEEAGRRANACEQRERAVHARREPYAQEWGTRFWESARGRLFFGGIK